MSVLGIIFSSLNQSEISRMTSVRTVAAIPFACRYRLVDFPLSSMVNAGINDVRIVANYNYRSLSEHVGSGKDWDLARRGGGVSLVSPFLTAGPGGAKMYTTHLEALLSMREMLMESRADTVVMMDSTYLSAIDLDKVLRAHRESGAALTMPVYPCPKEYATSVRHLMAGFASDRITPEMILSNRFDARHPLLSMNIFVFRREYLCALLTDAYAHNYRSLSGDILIHGDHARRTQIFHYDGTVLNISSFEEYYRCSMELCRNEQLRRELLEQEDRRVYTCVHNSSPVIYQQGARISSSMIADDCVIGGTVENSLLFRGVHIGKGAVVRNSVLLNGTYVADGAVVDSVVTDVDVSIGDGRVLCGCDTLPVYVDRGRHV